MAKSVTYDGCGLRCGLCVSKANLTILWIVGTCKYIVHTIISWPILLFYLN